MACNGAMPQSTLIDIVSEGSEVYWGIGKELSKRDRSYVGELYGGGDTMCNVDELYETVLGTTYELDEFIHLVGSNPCENGVLVVLLL
jgi:hypothetical protein